MRPIIRTSDRAAKAVVFVETFCFPILFAYFTFVHCRVLYGLRAQLLGGVLSMLHFGIASGNVHFLLWVNMKFVAIAINITAIAGLLSRPRSGVVFSNWPELLVPLISTFSSLIVNFLVDVPVENRIYLAPGVLLPYLSMAGMSIVLLGGVLSASGIFCLGSSFSIFVQQRAIVTSGIYAWMRHPIYLGHAMRLAGYCLMSPFLRYALMSLLMIILLAYRATLEERRLCADDFYRRYARKTPSLLLRMFGLSAPPAAFPS